MEQIKPIWQEKEDFLKKMTKAWVFPESIEGILKNNEIKSLLLVAQEDMESFAFPDNFLSNMLRIGNIFAYS